MTSRWLQQRGNRRGIVAVASGLAVLTAGFAVAPQTATAAPAPQTIAQAKAKVAKLRQQAEAADQNYQALKQKLDQSNQDLKDKQAELGAESKKVAQMKKQVATVALAEFQNRGLNTSAQLFLTRDPAGFLSQFATVEKFNQNQNMALQNYQIEQANVADLQRSTQADIALLKQERVQLAKLRSEADGKVKDAQSVLDKLTAAQRRRIAAEQARQAQQAQQASQNSANNTAANAIASSNAPASGKGEIALAFARAQIGKPYVFGATGPSSYDCSGLTQAAWAAAGVQISRTSEEQFHDGVPVSRSQLQPGDLVFFYDSVAPSHVGIYAGGGTVIHAPQPGESVTYIKMSYMPYVGARRPA